MKKRAFVVGINDYSTIDPSGKSNLTSCVADADSMMELLVSASGFDSAESVKLTDTSAGYERIQLFYCAIDRLRPTAESNTAAPRPEKSNEPRISTRFHRLVMIRV